MLNKHRGETRTNIILVVLVIAVCFSLAYAFGVITLSTNNNVPTITIPGVTTTTSVTNPSQTYPASRVITVVLVDKYATTGALSSKAIYIWEEGSNGLQSMPSVTTGSDGSVDTSTKYMSGTKLWFEAVVTASQAMVWSEQTVPFMTQADASNSAVKHQIVIAAFSYTAPTLTVMDSSGNAYQTDGIYNYTSPTRGTSPVFTIGWHEGTDNRGYIESYDPINNVWWKALLVVKFSGTNYELITVNGFDGVSSNAKGRGGVSKGSANYYCAEINPISITRWKPGSTYTYTGDGSFTLSLDLSGYSGNAAQMDIYVYFYADWDNFVAKGSFGPSALSVISGAPFTVDFSAVTS